MTDKTRVRRQAKRKGHDPFGDFRPPVTNPYGSVPMTDPADAARPEGLLTEEEFRVLRVRAEGSTEGWRNLVAALLADRAARAAECERLRALCREATDYMDAQADRLAQGRASARVTSDLRSQAKKYRAAATGGAHGC